jgi:hypothetical protein
LLYNRLEPILDPQQSRDQAGFRHNRSTTDHLFTTTLLQETADEWQLPMWIAAVDFKKAFDSVTHDALWKSLKEQGVDTSLIELLQKLYMTQTAAVRTDCTSRSFNMERGVKQGDPLSSLLFNSVSESLLRKLKQKWHTNRWGMRMQPDDDTRITNLRFADDILLVATSLTHLTKMLTDLSVEAGKVGLQLHPEKTKVLHNNHHNSRPRVPNQVCANGMDIEVLSTTGSTKYLGRKVSFSDPHRVELENRISIAWKRFFMLKQELTGHRYSLSDRLRLFHGTITPTILYGSEAWTLTADLENRLRRTQRQMLRMILHAPRRILDHDDITQPTEPPNTQQTPPQPGSTTTNPDQHTRDTDVGNDDHDDDDDVNSTCSRTPVLPQHEDDDNTNLEPWIDWIRRCTHEIEERMNKLNLDDWVTTQRRRKWKWAMKLANDTTDSLTTVVLRWDPTLDTQLESRRRPGRPKARWSDDIRNYIRQIYDAISTTTATNVHNQANTMHDHNQWMELAKDSSTWVALEDGYAEFNSTGS